MCGPPAHGTLVTDAESALSHPRKVVDIGYRASPGFKGFPAPHLRSAARRPLWLPPDPRHSRNRFDGAPARKIGKLTRPIQDRTRLISNSSCALAKAFAQQAELDQAIDRVKQSLGPDVVRLRYTLGQDWSGESAIFFRIVLSERASRRDQLWNSTSQIETAIVQQLQPLEQWGVLPYFNYRSQSEQATLQEEAWA